MCRGSIARRALLECRVNATICDNLCTLETLGARSGGAYLLPTGVNGIGREGELGRCLENLWKCHTRHLHEGDNPLSVFRNMSEAQPVLPTRRTLPCFPAPLYNRRISIFLGILNISFLKSIDARQAKSILQPISSITCCCYKISSYEKNIFRLVGLCKEVDYKKTYNTLKILFNMHF
jgi:hypothetical protein